MKHHFVGLEIEFVYIISIASEILETETKENDSFVERNVVMNY